MGHFFWGRLSEDQWSCVGPSPAFSTACTTLKGKGDIHVYTLHCARWSVHIVLQTHSPGKAIGLITPVQGHTSPKYLELLLLLLTSMCMCPTAVSSYYSKASSEEEAIIFGWGRLEICKNKVNSELGRA